MKRLNPGNIPVIEGEVMPRSSNKHKIVSKILMGVLVLAGTWFIGKAVYFAAVETSHIARITWSHLVAIDDDYRLNRAKRRVEAGESITKEAMAIYENASAAGKKNIEKNVEAKNSGVADPRPYIPQAEAFPTPKNH